MSPGETTCWTIIRGAAAGRADDRRAFAERYARAVRAYLAARWARSPLEQDVDDALQAVFVECFRAGGALERLDVMRANQSGGFRGFLFGVVRHVAQRVEQRRGRSREGSGGGDRASRVAEDPSLTRVFDRAWATTIMREAAARQGEEAAARGPEAVRRVELLRLRFREGLPIRTIAGLWEADPTQLHREYAKARTEFRSALEAVIQDEIGPAAEADRECAYLLGVLG